MNLMHAYHVVIYHIKVGVLKYTYYDVWLIYIDSLYNFVNDEIVLNIVSLKNTYTDRIWLSLKTFESM